MESTQDLTITREQFNNFKSLYCANYMGLKPIRPFEFNGILYACTGIGYPMEGPRYLTAYSLVPASEHVKNHGELPKREPGSYYGVLVVANGERFILTEKVKLTVD